MNRRPFAHGGYYYYFREEKGKQYRIYCRKKGSLQAAEQVLLDLNAEAKGHDFLHMGNFAVSSDHSLLAFALDTDGSETYTLRIKDLGNGELLPDRIENTYYGAGVGQRQLYPLLHDT